MKYDYLRFRFVALNEDFELALSILTDIIKIKYTEPTSDASQRHSTLTSAAGSDFTEKILIEFNKSDGSVKHGAGTYEFIYNGDVVGSIYIDPVTGNHYMK